MDFPDGDGEAALLEELRSLGLLGEGTAADAPIVAFPVVRAAHFLVFTSFEAQAALAMGRPGLSGVMPYQIDKQFLPGGDAPSPN